MLLTGLIAAAIPLALYLSCPSTLWNFDGVACAAAVELGNPVYWFHAHHLLYGFLGALTWKLLAPLGFVRALPALQMLSSLLSVGGAYWMYRLLVTQMSSRLLAFLMTTAAAASAVVWVWSVEAQVYPLGYLGLAGATFTLLSPSDKGRGWKTGAWHALAILGHVVHGLWVIPAFYLLKNDRPTLRHYAVTLISIVGTAYAAVALFVLAPYQGAPHWLAHWMKGSLGLTPDRSMAWHWPGLSGAWIWLSTAPQTWWGSFAPYGGVGTPFFIRAITGLSIVLFVFLMTRALHSSDHQRRIRFSLIWIGVYALFFSTWEPGTPCYRMTDVLPWTILLAFGVSTLSSWRLKTIAAIAWLFPLVLINVWTKAWPMRNSELNTTYRQTMALVKTSPESSTYLTEGGLPWIYLLYFSGRSAWNATALPDDKLNGLPRPIYMHTALLTDSRMRDWLSRRPARHVAPELPWLEIS